MDEKNKKSRWSVEQRLEFIDFQLFWNGRVNRRDLINHFEISVPQASADLAQYQQVAPQNALYDKTLKTYVRGPEFKPTFFTPSADKYLAQLRLIDSEILDKNDTRATSLPDFATVPMLRRRIEPSILRQIIEAIRTRSQLKITYQSMYSVQPSNRWIAPHALGFDGFRWHTRAWCYKRLKFTDFVLARVLKTDEAKPSEINPGNDVAWQRTITLFFKPHPDLSESQKRVVELDYGMIDGVASITTRICMSDYLERRFGLHIDGSKADAKQQQIVLANRHELDAVRTEVWGNDGLEDGQN